MFQNQNILVCRQSQIFSILIFQHLPEIRSELCTNKIYQLDRVPEKGFLAYSVAKKMAMSMVNMKSN